MRIKAMNANGKWRKLDCVCKENDWQFISDEREWKVKKLYHIVDNVIILPDTVVFQCYNCGYQVAISEYSWQKMKDTKCK